jgi:hypothetical protein
MTKHLIKIKISNIVSKRQNKPSRFYLVMAAIRAFGQNIRGLIIAGIIACAAGALHCTSNPRRRASSDVFCTSSRCLLAAGLSDLHVA